MESHDCPVCGLKDAFESYGSMDYCERCGWGDDPIQLEEPTYKGGENKMSLEEARIAYKEGRVIE